MRPISFAEASNHRFISVPFLSHCSFNNRFIRPSALLALVFIASGFEGLDRFHACAAQAGEPPSGSADATNAWRLVRTPGGVGKPDALSIMHTADFERSDPLLAGLMLRCGDAGIETIIVLIEPFPPEARPKITLRADGQESYFEGRSTLTGVGVRVPIDAMDKATNSWRRARELFVQISEGKTEIDGVVKLSGLDAAIQPLSACFTR